MDAREREAALLCMTAQQVKDCEGHPEAIDEYARGYELGRRDSLVRLARVDVWIALGAFSIGYRNGWRVEGRPV